jgi:hypothetical protein
VGFPSIVSNLGGSMKLKIFFIQAVDMKDFSRSFSASMTKKRFCDKFFLMTAVKNVLCERFYTNDR